VAEDRTVVRVDIKATIEEAWHEITRTGSVQRAYYDTVLQGEMRKGTEYRYTTPDGKRTFIKGMILEIDPPRRLVTTFRFLGSKDPEARVTYELETIPGGVRVTLVHEGLDTTKRQGRRVAAGWNEILGNLRITMETGRLPLGTRVKYAVMKVLMPLMPKGE
jgi:uncharacterized protein YndB with AHSA1/START domain